MAETEQAATGTEDWTEVAAAGDERFDGDGDWVRPDGAFFAELNLVIMLLWLSSRSNSNEDGLDFHGGEGEPKSSKQDEAEDQRMVKLEGKAKGKPRRRQANDFKLLRRTHQRCQPKPKDLRHCRKM